MRFRLVGTRSHLQVGNLRKFYSHSSGKWHKFVAPLMGLTWKKKLNSAIYLTDTTQPNALKGQYSLLDPTVGIMSLALTGLNRNHRVLGP